MNRAGWRRERLAVWLLLLGVVLAGGRVAAAAEPKGYTLDQLVEMALNKSPELKVADQEIVSAQSDLQQAKAGQWAQLDITGVVGPISNASKPKVIVNPKPVDGVLIGEIEGNEEGIGYFGRLDLEIVQPLYTFGKISNRQDAAALGVEAQRAGKDQKRGEVILSVKRLYYGLVLARQGMGAADDADSFVRDARTRIQQLLKAGSTTVDQSDLYRLDAYGAEIQQFKVKADSEAKLAALALKQTVGLPFDQEIRLDVTELPKPTPLPESQEAYIQKALGQRPELKQLKKGIEAQQSMVDAATADLYPSFFASVIGSFAEAPRRQSFASNYIYDEFNHAEVGLVLGSQWHFDLGVGKGKVNKEKAQYQKLIHTREYAEQNIPLEVARDYQDTVSALSSYENYHKAAVAARKWVVSAFSNFDMGVGSAKDIFDAIDRYGKNQGEYLSSLYDYHTSRASLEYAIGAYGLDRQE